MVGFVRGLLWCQHAHCHVHLFVPQALQACTYCLLDIVSGHDMQQLHANLARVPGARSMMRSIRKKYNEEHRYTGGLE